MKKNIGIGSVLVFLFLSVTCATSSPGMSNEEGNSQDAPALIGRISHVEGTLSGYDSEETQWFEISEDSPFGFNDRLKTEQNSRAEILLPNHTWIRLDQETEIELISLESQETSVNLHYGKARFLNKGSNTRITVATPSGQVTAPAMTTLDISVEEATVHILPSNGSVYLNRGDGSTEEIRPGSNGILVDGETIVAGREGLDPAWNNWNSQRDSVWAKRIQSGARSAEYLPSALHDQASVLQDNGVWERVYYEGEYGNFWRPVHVPPGWSPFSVGRWRVWYGDHVWIPAEPFGYVTHHYGSWVFAHGRWYWVPPMPSVSVALGHPRWRIGFAWYPGRVAWIHSHLHVGWLPLAPYEPYYTHRRWGPRSVVLKNVHITDIHVQKYAHIDHAVAVAREDLYRHDNHKNQRIQRPHRSSIAHEYRALPAIERASVSKRAERAPDFRNRGNSERRMSSRGASAADSGTIRRERQNEVDTRTRQGRSPENSPRPESGRPNGLSPDRQNRVERRPPVSMNKEEKKENDRTTTGRGVRDRGFSGRTQRPEQQVNPLRAPVNRETSPADGGNHGRISNKGGHKERDFRREDGEKPHGSVRRERSEDNTGHRFAPVPQNKNTERNSNRGREEFRPERVQPRANERRSERLHPSERRQPISNQVKKDRVGNQERQELKRSEKGHRGPGPRV